MGDFIFAQLDKKSVDLFENGSNKFDLRELITTSLSFFFKEKKNYPNARHFEFDD